MKRFYLTIMYIQEVMSIFLYRIAAWNGLLGNQVFIQPIVSFSWLKMTNIKPTKNVVRGSLRRQGVAIALFSLICLSGGHSWTIDIEAWHRRIRNRKLWYHDILGDPEVTANIYCKSRNIPNTENYSTEFAVTSGSPSILLPVIIH